MDQGRRGRYGFGRTTFTTIFLYLVGVGYSTLGGVAHTWLALRLVLNCNGQLLALCCADLPPTPHQPSGHRFPKRAFGKKTVVWRSFQQSWFNQWTWLHYDEANDLAYCHTCVSGFKQQKMKASNADPVIVSSF